MSSTGRGSEREPEDQYFTRYPLALAICEKLREDGVVSSPNTILEPSAGAGSFVSAAAEVWKPRRMCWNDLDTGLILQEHHQRACENSDEMIRLNQDFLTLHGGHGHFDLAVGNPPYKHSEAHVRHAISLLAPGGVLAFLLPVNFLAGIKRVGALYQGHPPEYVYVLDKRPQFVDGYRINKHGKRVKKGTDSNEYGVFVWRKERPEFEPVVRWLQWSKYLQRFKNVVARVEVQGEQNVDIDDDDVAGSAATGEMTE